MTFSDEETQTKFYTLNTAELSMWYDWEKEFIGDGMTLHLVSMSKDPSSTEFVIKFVQAPLDHEQS